MASAPTPAAPPVTVPPKPTFMDAFKYTREQIVAHVTNIKNDPSTFCSDTEYLQPHTFPARAKTATEAAVPATTVGPQLVEACEVIIHLATTKFVVYPLPLKVNGNFNPAQFTQAGTAKFLTHDYQLELLHITFQGVRLPANTIYDLLGWVLSITWTPTGMTPAQITDANYYFPLLALYSKWCRVLTGSNKNAPAMTHIAWFTTAPSGPVSVLLGSTLGKDNQRPEVLARWRQLYMTDLKLVPRNADQLVNKDGDEGRTGFGKCAETFFWIVAKTEKIPPANIKGFAMDPTDKEFAKLKEYNPAIAGGALMQPCLNSCRFLITQIDKTWKWRKSFDVEKLQKLLAKTTSPPVDEDGISDTPDAAATTSTSPPGSYAAAAARGGSSVATQIANAAVANLPAIIGSALSPQIQKR